MFFFMTKVAVVAFSLATTLQAEPDISNLSNCIKDVRKAEAAPPSVPDFENYKNNFKLLISDLEKAAASLPVVYQEAAFKPLLTFLKNLGETEYYKVFGNNPNEQQEVLQEMIPDAVLAILQNNSTYEAGINAFQEVVSDLYDGFLSDESRVSKQTGKPINPPTYGTIPPLVKYGNADYGPYTWPCDATSEILGLKCGLVSLPPAQIKGGLIAWSCLGHETGGHDVTHADEGLLDELAKKVYDALLAKYKSKDLATYWSNCIDETTADVCGYLNMGPSLGIGLIGYFRALGNGKLRTVGSTDDPHPIDLLRGYLAAAVIKRLSFKDNTAWSQVVTQETAKDKGTLYLADDYGFYHSFPVSFDKAVASTDLVAQVILQTKLSCLQGHSLQELQDWKDQDQAIVDSLVTILKVNGKLPANLMGPGFYASYVVASATQAALQKGANIAAIFTEMQSFLATMHQSNPCWSKTTNSSTVAKIESLTEKRKGETTRRYVTRKLPEQENVLVGQL